MRTKPTTSWDNRNPITTTYTARQKLSYLLQETFDKLLLEDGGGILLEKSVFNTWNTPRYGNILLDLHGNNVFDLHGEQIISLKQGNTLLIRTNWT